MSINPCGSGSLVPCPLTPAFCLLPPSCAADGSCEQVLEHPGCVWGVAFLPNGDLLTACGDGVARVWTRDAARRAPEDVATRFQEAMAAQKRRWDPVTEMNVGPMCRDVGFGLGIQKELCSLVEPPWCCCLRSETFLQVVKGTGSVEPQGQSPWAVACAPSLWE